MLVLGLVLGLAAGAVAAEPGPFWSVVSVAGADLACLRGAAAAEVAAQACDGECAPIPWQLAERDEHGRWALEAGPESNPDRPPGVLDDNDELLWMFDDGGPRREDDGGHGPSDEVTCTVEVRTALGGEERFVYLTRHEHPAPRSPRRYVTYDPATDRAAGARVALGLAGDTPRHLALRDSGDAFGESLLDRLKIRVHAWFLGVIPVWRDEGDLTTERVAWSAGAIRVMRRQRQWVHVGFGIRSPTFVSEARVHRDFARIPVRLRLNFPPTYFFRAIRIRALLDFRALDGWAVYAPGVDRRVGDGAGEWRAPETDWFALRGDGPTLVNVLETSPSLASVRRRLFYRETEDSQPPEGVPGEHPAIGYELTEWEEVDRGTHSLWSLSYALSEGYPLERFLELRGEEPVVEVWRRR